MRVVYVSHNGIASPLVRSQVLPYLRLLGHRGHEIDLVTFERAGSYPEGEFPRDRWHSVRPTAGRSLFAKMADIVRGTIVVATVARARRVDGLHARSYVPAAICWLVGRVIGRPYIFDMRGFMTEEYVDVGLWGSRDIRHLTARLAEGRLLHDAAEIVVLTNAAARRLRVDARYADAAKGRPVAVVPCAVDLDRFAPVPAHEHAPTVVYAGSLGSWYLLREMIDVYSCARARRPDLRFLFLNRDEHALIRAAWNAAGLPADLLEIQSADPAEVPKQLGRADVGIALMRMVPSKIGSSPIKIAEYLACGLPVITNAGLGDTEELIRTANAGHVLDAFDRASISLAASALLDLLVDGSARQRARALAERVFDARGGAATYDRVYTRLKVG